MKQRIKTWTAGWYWYLLNETLVRLGLRSACCYAKLFRPQRYAYRFCGECLEAKCHVGHKYGLLI